MRNFKFIKFPLIIMLLISIMLGLFPLSMSANAKFTLFNSGTWWDTRQAIRISVYNLTDGVCEATRDFFYNGKKRKNTSGVPMGSYDQFDNDFTKAQNNGYDIILCQGCKIDYLNDYYQSGRDLDSLEYCQIDSNQMSTSYSDTSDDIFDSLIYSLSPLNCFDHFGDEYYYDDSTSYTGRLHSIENAKVIQSLINCLGYYLVETKYAKENNLTFLDSNYILVFEPVYWFLDAYRTENDKEVLFYGSATEWAIYAQKNIGHYQMGTTRKGRSIHSTMGTLTAVAGPLTCYSPKKRFIPMNNGTDYITIQAHPDKKSFQTWWNTKSISMDANTVSEINKKIIEETGADYLLPKDLYDMSFEIQNSSFFTDTQVLLSFKAESDGKRALIPSYEDMESGDYYGIKLTLETLPGSDINPGNIVLYSDGMPDSETGGQIVTYIYDNWYTGTKEGVWQFALHAESPEGRISYKSNSGTPIDPESEDTDYSFVIKISDLRSMVVVPENTKSSDKAPSGFWQPSGDMSGYSPKHEASWNTYVANAWKTAEGKEMVFLTKKDFTKSITMSGTSPVCYPNIASAYMDSNGELVTKSGYGIGIDGHYTVDGSYGDVRGGFQNGVVLYPEYGYGLVGSLMEPDGSSGMYLEQNSYSKYYRDARNSLYSRVHFTPIWYPDGEYNVQVFMFDCWTPVGMLWDCQKYTVHINGTMYDDWYVTRN